MSMYDRWADDEKYGDGGLAPADEELPLQTQAIGLAIHKEVRGPWERLKQVPEGDDEAYEAWKRWCRGFIETEMPIIQQAINLAKDDIWEPYRRFMELPYVDDAAYEDWKAWFRIWLKRRERRLP